MGMRAHPRRCGEHRPEPRRHRPLIGLIPAGAGNIPWWGRERPARRAHPRRCGEHHIIDPTGTQSAGSSPQVRGTSQCRRCCWSRRGLIPAGAGNIAKGSKWERMTKGSSPQVRGTSEFGAFGCCDVGLIPAGAGNIRRAPTTGAGRRAHPRRCGEHPVGWRQHLAGAGSSPQVRGTSCDARHTSPARRLIPAGAGNIPTAERSRLHPGAHPRRCGEHPLTWIVSGDSPGLIPAGAGNIPDHCTPSRLRRAHPRRCGEHAHLHRRLCPPPGSSPQVRGTSPPTPSRTSSRPAHPRRCGEHYRTRGHDDTPRGSSPQVRGTFHAAGPVPQVIRLIPAGAGNIGCGPRTGTCTRAHPRRCGEHFVGEVGERCPEGSSPQVRGTWPPPSA